MSSFLYVQYNISKIIFNTFVKRIKRQFSHDYFEI